MDWTKLLSAKRIRELAGGRPSGVNDHRTPFQSDFDRVVFCSPVKRLQDKAQVFPLEPNDAVRTRLTHSLEVSCVARGMGQRIGRDLHKTKPQFVSEADARAFEDICGTAGLIHDLGNPPFGHYGEDALSDWFKSTKGKNALKPLESLPWLRDDFAHYEGNARTIRLLCHLQVLSDQFGLNLTAATLGTTMKYVVPSHKVDKNNQSHKKPGYCYSEARYVELIRDETGIGDARHPLAYLVEAADDCVYSICDLEDGVKKGIISFDDLGKALAESAKYLELDDSLVTDLVKKSADAVTQGIVDGPKLTGRAREEAFMQMFRVQAIGVVVESVCSAFIKNYEAIFEGQYAGELVADTHASAAKTLVKSAKHLGVERIYCTRPTVELELRGGHIIQSLMDNLWVGIDPATCETPQGRRLSSLVSQNYRHVNTFECEQEKKKPFLDGVTEKQLRRYYDLMLLTDYIGGMTDSYASNLYCSLTHG